MTSPLSRESRLLWIGVVCLAAAATLSFCQESHTRARVATLIAQEDARRTCLLARADAWRYSADSWFEALRSAQAMKPSPARERLLRRAYAIREASLEEYGRKHCPL